MKARFYCYGLIFTALLLFAALFSASAFAGNKDDEYSSVFMPKLEYGSVIIDDDDIPPSEPNIVKITFLKNTPVIGLGERVERLIQGITLDIPPEYDIYGYEIRRYMAHAGNPKIYTDEDYLIDQIRNVRKARIILRYWQEYLANEVDEIEKLIEDQDSSSSIRTSFRQNKAIVRSFMVAAQGWLDSNERLLMNVFDTFGYVTVDYPELIFLRPHQRIDFYNLFVARQSKLKEIHKYTAFSTMPY